MSSSPDQKKTVKSYLQKHKNTGQQSSPGNAKVTNQAAGSNRISSGSRTDTKPASAKNNGSRIAPIVKSSADSKFGATAASETRSSYLRRNVAAIRLHSNGSIEGLPDEMLLNIFGYLSPNDLLSCARVSKRWLYLAKDNLLWENIYKLYAEKQGTGSKNNKTVTGNKSANLKSGPSHWKAMCIRNCKEARDKKILPMIKKVSPYTGLPLNTEKALRKSGVRFLLCFEDRDGIDHVINHSDVFYFNMSVCVRWYELVMVPLLRIMKVKIYSGNPVFFDEKGGAVPNSPCQRSLLFEMDFRWSDWKGSNKPQGGDDMVDVHIVPGGLLVASFKDGKDIAFITANFHSHNILQRCLQGTSTSVYTLQNHTPTSDDIDSKYGLHDYTCNIELRNQRTSFWNQQFRNLYTKEGDLSTTHARFVLLDPENDYERSSVAKKISFLWKTEVFKGCIPDLCFMDLTLLDERQKPMWCVSSAVNLTRPEISGVSYAFDGDHSIIEYKDAKGKVVMRFIWDEGEKHYFMVGLEILLALSHVNLWFGTKY